jgi:hypothetical protein
LRWRLRLILLKINYQLFRDHLRQILTSAVSDNRAGVEQEG